ARVVAGLVAVARGEGFDHDDAPAPRARAFLQGQGQAGAHQPAADDGQLDPFHQACSRDAVAISASISATLLGTSPVRISQPSAVTTTSSSMRTPMPRQRGSTCSLSGAM